MKGNDDILEENDVLFSEGNCETGNNGSKDVEQLGSPIEFESLMDQTVEAVVNSFSDHLSTRNKLGIETMKDIF